MSTWELKHQATLEEWKSKAQVCQGSGSSVAEWCQDDHDNSKTYYRWERQVLDSMMQSTMPEENKLAQLPAPIFAPVPVPVRQESTQGSVTASVRIGQAELDAYPGADDYVVVRIHEENGESVVTILDTLYDAKTGAVTFETDESSAYAIVGLSTVEGDASLTDDNETDAGLSDSNVTDRSGETENSSSAEDVSGAESESPKTGDSTPVYMMKLLMFCAACGCAVLVVRGKHI